jgi:Tfp pilus assembly protein PilF
MKSRPYFCTLLLCLVYTYWPERISAQAPSGSIVGQVRIARASFPENPILVTLEGRGILITTIYTDNEGRFGFNGLPGNIYHVIIREKEFAPVRETVNINPETTPVAMLTIYLNPIEATQTKVTGITGGNQHLADPAEFTKHIRKPARKEFNKGVDSDKAGKLDDAIEHYRRAIAQAPEFYAARNNLGSDLLRQSRFSEAQQQFEAVIEINPSDAAAYFNLGNLYLLTQRNDEAQRLVEQGLTKQPDSALGHFLHGSVLASGSKVQAAEGALRRSLELDPLLGKARLALVNIYLIQHRTTEAIAELRSFLAAAPKDPLATKASEVLKRLETTPANAGP